MLFVFRLKNVVVATEVEDFLFGRLAFDLLEEVVDLALFLRRLLFYDLRRPGLFRLLGWLRFR